MIDEYNPEDFHRLAGYVWKKADADVLNSQDVEDLISEVLVVAVADKAKREDISLVALAVKVAKWPRYFSKAKKRANREARNHHFGTESRTVGAETITGADLDDVVIHESRWRSKIDFVTEADLRMLIAQLPLAQRQAFTLVAEHGYTLEQAGIMTGVSTMTVKRNLARARATLQAAVLGD